MWSMQLTKLSVGLRDTEPWHLLSARATFKACLSLSWTQVGFLRFLVSTDVGQSSEGIIKITSCNSCNLLLSRETRNIGANSCYLTSSGLTASALQINNLVPFCSWNEAWEIDLPWDYSGNQWDRDLTLLYSKPWGSAQSAHCFCLKKAQEIHSFIL